MEPYGVRPNTFFSTWNDVTRLIAPWSGLLTWHNLTEGAGPMEYHTVNQGVLEPALEKMFEFCPLKHILKMFLGLPIHGF